MVVVDLRFPNGGLSGGDIIGPIDGDKLEAPRQTTVQLFNTATVVSAVADEVLAIIRGDQGTVVSFEAMIQVQATGADRTVSVDLQKSTGGAAYATICTTMCEIDDDTVIRTPVPAVLSNTTLVDGDSLRAVVTVAGSAGAQAYGLSVTLQWYEDA